MTYKRYEIIATTFDKKGNVLGAGVNCYKKSHPLMRKYAIRAGESEKKIYKHAELSAILAAGNKDIYRILVQRFDDNGNYALAMPCKTCQEIIKDFGIKVVEYTSPEGIKRMQID